MAFIVRGVQLFFGLSAPDEWGEGPLRRVDRLCGLLLGEKDTFNFDDFGGQEIDQPGQIVQRIRLAAKDGCLVDGEELCVNGHGAFQPFPAQKANF